LFPYILYENCIYLLAIEMASPGNQHCANCFGALSIPVILLTCCTEKQRRFIKRDPASEPVDFDAEPAGKINNQQTVITAADAAAAADNSIASRAATSSLLNGHTTAECQPSEEAVLVIDRTTHDRIY